MPQRPLSDLAAVSQWSWKPGEILRIGRWLDHLKGMGNGWMDAPNDANTDAFTAKLTECGGFEAAINLRTKMCLLARDHDVPWTMSKSWVAVASQIVMQIEEDYAGTEFPTDHLPLEPVSPQEDTPPFQTHDPLDRDTFFFRADTEEGNMALAVVGVNDASNWLKLSKMIMAGDIPEEWSPRFAMTIGVVCGAAMKTLYRNEVVDCDELLQLTEDIVTGRQWEPEE